MKNLLNILDKYGLDYEDFACLINELSQNEKNNLDEFIKKANKEGEKLHQTRRKKVERKAVEWFEKSKKDKIFEKFDEENIDFKNLFLDQIVYYYKNYIESGLGEIYPLTKESVVFSKFYDFFIDNHTHEEAWRLAKFLTHALIIREQIELLKTLEKDQNTIDTIYSMYPPSLIDKKIVVPVGNKRFLIDKDIRLDKEQKHTLELLAKETTLRNPVYIAIEDGVIIAE